MNPENQTMAPTMIPKNNHLEMPGNPSTATSSKISLNDRSQGQPLRVLSEEDWAFWKHNGYVVIKQAVPRDQALATAQFIWDFEEKNPEIDSNFKRKKNERETKIQFHA